MTGEADERGAPRPLRDWSAGRAGIAKHAGADGRALRVGRCRTSDHRRRVDDHDVDRPTSHGWRRHRPRADSRPLRRRSPRHSGQVGRAGGEGTDRSARDTGLLRALRRDAGLRRLGHRDPRGDQQRSTPEPRPDPSRGRALPRVWCRRDRYRLYARSGVSQAGRRCARTRRCGNASEHRHLRRGRDSNCGASRRACCPQRESDERRNRQRALVISSQVGRCAGVGRVDRHARAHDRRSSRHGVFRTSSIRSSNRSAWGSWPLSSATPTPVVAGPTPRC